MSLTRNLRPGGKLGLARGESRDPIGLAVAALNRVAQSDLIDRIGLRKQAEQAVFTVTRSGFRTMTTAARTFDRSGSASADGRTRPGSAPTGRLRPDARARTSRCSSTS